MEVDKKKELRKETREENGRVDTTPVHGSHPASHHHTISQPVHLPGVSTTTPGTSLKDFHDHHLEAVHSSGSVSTKEDDSDSNDSDDDKDDEDDEDKEDISVREEEERGRTHHTPDIAPDNPQDSFSNQRAREDRDAKGDSNEDPMKDTPAQTNNSEE